MLFRAGPLYTAEMNELVHSSSARVPSARARTAVKPAAKTKIARETTRTNDPARTMAGILEVATKEFADKGLSGARIDEIAAATKTSKRMIYYYFGSKEGLYVAVLEDQYRRMRKIEAEQHLEDLAPEAALRKLVAFTFDHHYGNQDYIRLVPTHLQIPAIDILEGSTASQPRCAIQDGL